MDKAEFPFGPNAAVVLERRYLARLKNGEVRESPHQMLKRVAHAVSEAEREHGGAAQAAQYAKSFYRLMADGLFLPNSPTLMNAGRSMGQLSACFVLPVEDSLEGIFEALKQSALIHKSGGGTGFSFSSLRPAGDLVSSTGGSSSGPVSFMAVFDAATHAVKQGGARRGANMAMLSASHPDIEEFVLAKSDLKRLNNFNLSVMANDAFFEGVRQGAHWELINPRTGEVARRVDASGLLDLMARAAHASGDPGLAFYDAINRANPLPGLGRITATNPCGEQPLLPHESCNLGSLVLSRFLRGGAIDYAALEDAAMLAVRFLDDALDVNRLPLPEIKKATLASRKIGLGVMGFAGLLCRLGISYDSDQAVSLGGQIMARIQAAAHQASRELGRVRGSFPAFGQSVFSQNGVTAMRNATVTTIAPTGTLSMLMGCSAGIEPLFALIMVKNVLEGERLREHNGCFMDLLKQKGLNTPENLDIVEASGSAAGVRGLSTDEKRVFLTAHEIPPQRHLEVQAAFQAHTDNAVSKTINLPNTASVDQVREIYLLAHRLGLKGVTVFRSGCRGEQVLQIAGQDAAPVLQLNPPTAACPGCGKALPMHEPCPTCNFCGASGCD
jgi:ribonucleoside-diphosphate reductase alpha chain